MLDLNEETYVFKNGFDLIGGIDEAGRGPLAGPVVAACVLLKKDFIFSDKNREFIKDSKKLSSRKREEMNEYIKNNFFEIGIGHCDHQTIDRINILQATFLAMKKAIGALKNKPDFVLIDGKFIIPNISIKQKAIIKGDEKVFLIAAASIIAKHTRDCLMEEFHKEYPQYGFDQHKGYGTKDHIRAIEKYGPSPIHRKSFSPIKEIFKENFLVNGCKINYNLK